MIISRSICVPASGIILFPLWLSNIPLDICAASSLSTHLSVDAGCFHVLAVVSSAAVNIGVHVSFKIIVSSEYPQFLEEDSDLQWSPLTFLAHITPEAAS